MVMLKAMDDQYTAANYYAASGIGSVFARNEIGDEWVVCISAEGGTEMVTDRCSRAVAVEVATEIADELCNCDLERDRFVIDVGRIFRKHGEKEKGDGDVPGPASRA